MPKFEYKFERVRALDDLDNLEAYLNERGAEGWRFMGWLQHEHRPEGEVDTFTQRGFLLERYVEDVYELNPLGTYDLRTGKEVTGENLPSE